MLRGRRLDTCGGATSFPSACDEWVAAPSRGHDELRLGAGTRRGRPETPLLARRRSTARVVRGRVIPLGGGGVCVDGEKRHDRDPTGQPRSSAVLAPGRRRVSARRPPPSRADARVVLDLVRAGRLLLYRAGGRGRGADARLVHAATGFGGLVPARRVARLAESASRRPAGNGAGRLTP